MKGSNTHGRARTFALVAALLLFTPTPVACTGDDGGTTTPDAGRASDAATSSDAATGTPDAGPRDAGPRDSGESDAAAAPLDEASSAHVITTIDKGEIQLAELAETRAMRADVLEYAETMIRDHADAQAMIDAWAAANDVTPTDNPVSMSVSAEAMATRDQLEPLSGSAFDAQYVASQVTMHTEALEIIDTMLLPGAQDADFRAILTTIRETVAEHRAHAMALASTSS